MSLLTRLQSAPHLPEIQDQEEVQARYKYWRWRIFYSMYAGYVFYYLTRKSFTFAMPALMEDLGYKMSDLAIVSSIFAISYGLSKFLSGVLADRSNPRYFMAIGLIMTGLINLVFGCCSSLFFFMVLWAMNGFFQGWGWPPCAKLLTHWYSQKERGRWWSVLNTSLSVGGGAIPFLAAWCISCSGWRFALYVPGVLCIGMGLVLMNRLRDVPQTLGLPPIEQFKRDGSSSKSTAQPKASVKEILFSSVFNNRYIWLLSISCFWIYVIRQAMNDFSALFLIKAKGYTILSASCSIPCFELGGLCGSLAAGWISDVIFKARRSPVSLLYSFCTIAAVFCFYFTPAQWIYLNYASLFLVGFCVFGPQMLIGMAAAEVVEKKAAATANGFVGWCSYLGAATAGYPIAKVTEYFGWEGFFLTLAACGALTVLLLLPLWHIKTHPKLATPAAS